MQALHDWLTVFLVCGAGGGLFFLTVLAVDAVMTRLDRPTRAREPRNAPRTRRQAYRPAAGEERE